MRLLWVAVLVETMMLPVAGHAQDLRTAQQLYLHSDLEGARREARLVVERSPAEAQAALRLLVAASCRLGDEAEAQRAFERLTPVHQCLAIQACTRLNVHVGPEPSGSLCKTGPAGADLVELVPPPPPRHRPFWIAMWTTAGAAATALGLAIGFGVRTRELQNEKDELLLQYGRNATWPWRSSDACAAAEANGARDLVDRCQSGKRSAIVANVMYGVTAALVIATGYLYYRGYVDVDRKVAVQPLATAQGGGLGISGAF